MRFRTSFGDQVLLIGLAPVIGLTVGSVNALRGEWLWAGVGALMVGLFAWVLLAARYTIVDGVLDIRCGLCHRRVRLSEVTGLHCRTLYKGPLRTRFGFHRHRIRRRQGGERLAGRCRRLHRRDPRGEPADSRTGSRQLNPPGNAWSASRGRSLVPEGVRWIASIAQ